MADNEDLDDLDPDMVERIERIISKREDARAKEAARKKPPKDFADAVDRIADAVLDKLDARAEQRRKDAEDADQPPSRDGGGAGSSFLRALGMTGSEG